MLLLKGIFRFYYIFMDICLVALCYPCSEFFSTKAKMRERAKEREKERVKERERGKEQE